MAKNPTRALLRGAAWTRTFCTDTTKKAVEATEKTKAKTAEVKAKTTMAPATETTTMAPATETTTNAGTKKSERRTIRATDSDLYRRLSALPVSKDATVSKVLNKWLLEGKTVKKFELDRFIRELRKFRRYRHALQLYEWMDARGINLSYSDYAVRLDLLYRSNGLAAAEEYFEARSEPAKNQLTYGALLNCYCMEKMPEKAMALLDKMKELNFASTSLVYSNLMSLYLKLGQPEKVPPLVQEMKDQNILPHSFTYNLLMNSYASLKDMGAVERVIEEMEKDGKAFCDWTTYSNLAAIYVAAGLFEKAESALKELEKIAPQRDRTAFHFLISLYAGTSNLTEVKRVWEVLKSAFMKTPNLSYLVMLQALGKLDDLDGLKDCFKEWEAGYLSYDIRLVNVLIGAYLRRDMVKEAESLWEIAMSKGAEPNFRTWEMFIDFYLKSGQIGSALKFFDSALSKVKGANDWQPSQKKVEGFLKYFEDEKDVDGAEEFCKKLKVLNSLNAKVYASLLRTYVAAGRSEPHIRQRMNDDEIVYDSETEKLIEKVCQG